MVERVLWNTFKRNFNIRNMDDKTSNKEKGEIGQKEVKLQTHKIELKC